MIRGWMSKASAALLLTASALALNTASAKAADLGGDCCADLEERIAELENTTARKGNRKVSLTVSGWVNEALFLWDDGTERNAYVGTNSLEQSRLKFTGEAKIMNDVSAGFTLELGTNGNQSSAFSQDVIGGGSSGQVTVRKSNWWIKSKSLGKMTVGQEGTATYHLLDDADIANTRNYSDAEAATVALGAFELQNSGAAIRRSAAANLRWQDLNQAPNNDTPGQNGRRNIVRYDTPEIVGFTGTASWGEDDMWGVALTYKNTMGDFGVLAKVGYEESTDESISRCNGIGAAVNNKADDHCQWWGAAGSVMHNPTGIYVYGAYGELKDDERTDVLPTADNEDRMWFIQAGIERKWWEIGKTTIFGEYRKDDNGTNSSVLVANTPGLFIQDSEVEHFAAGIVQNVANAAMDFYVLYRHTEGEFTDTNGVKTDLDDFDMVITGARIQF